MNKFSKIKKSIVWKYFLLLIVKPIYQFLWEYIINIEGKILYFKWFYNNKRKYFNFNSRDQLLLSDELSFNEIAKEILSKCNYEILNKSREDIKNRNTNSNLSNSGLKAYKNNLNYLLETSIKKKIFEYACSEKIISTAAKYLKVFPTLNRIEVYHNIPNQSEKVRGAMMWHRDDFGYKSLDLFIAITDIDDENGPLYSVDKREKLGVFAKFSETINNPTSGERGKIEDQKFETYLKKMGCVILKGKTGTGLFIDSFTTYHKGGQCLSKERIMLRLSYTTPDAINLDDNSEELKFYDKYSKNSMIDNKYINFLLFKKKIFFNKLVSKNSLLYVYRLLHYKI
tara:strand:+ start:486 stop:1508 length:1023 start_codon:yes stop_codon:yes gene_type:complete